MLHESVLLALHVGATRGGQDKHAVTRLDDERVGPFRRAGDEVCVAVEAAIGADVALAAVGAVGRGERP